MSEQSPDSSSGDARLSIAPFGVGHPDCSEDLKMLHQELLGHSPVVLLGPDFLERVYYSKLPELGLVFGAIARIDGKPAGFIAVTEDSDGFMSTAIRRRWYLIAWVLTISILKRPKRILGIWEALKIMRGREAQRTEEPMAELLSFGVTEEFRGAAFVRKTGLKVGGLLYDYAVEELKRRGCKSAKVLVDQDNRNVKMMYSALGWTVTNSDVPGWQTPQVELQTDL
ncbi:MAG: GNAT family N-acetyltransferase [Woeseiaceae bacterium]|nr:GNAT family N-acetyltransferase [Woeseiaceae bacterium]